MDNNQFLTDWGLTLMVFLPLAGALVMMLIPKSEEAAHKWVALAVALATAGIGAAVIADFDYGATDTLQFAVNKAWIDVINSRYAIGIDGLSVPLDRADAADRRRCASSTRGTTSPSPATPRRSSSCCWCCTPACSAPSWRRT